MASLWFQVLKKNVLRMEPGFPRESSAGESLRVPPLGIRLCQRPLHSDYAFLQRPERLRGCLGRAETLHPWVDREFDPNQLPAVLDPIEYLSLPTSAVLSSSVRCYCTVAFSEFLFWGSLSNLQSAPLAASVLFSFSLAGCCSQTFIYSQLNLLFSICCAPQKYSLLSLRPRCNSFLALPCSFVRHVRETVNPASAANVHFPSDSHRPSLSALFRNRNTVCWRHKSENRRNYGFSVKTSNFGLRQHLFLSTLRQTYCYLKYQRYAFCPQTPLRTTFGSPGLLNAL